IVLVGEADFDAPAMIEHRLQGEALRFKMLTIQAAFRQVVASHPNQNPGMSRGWSLYRRALRGTLAAIDGPLESLTAALGAKQGLVEFKKALEVLLDLRSGRAPDQALDLGHGHGARQEGQDDIGQAARPPDQQRGDRPSPA